jgi:hypothetical protein
MPLVGVIKKALRRPGTSGLIAGWGPAASDLTARYEDVRTRLDGLSIVHSFRVSVSVSRGAAIKRYPRRSPGYYRFEPKIFPPVKATTSGQPILAKIKNCERGFGDALLARILLS